MATLKTDVISVLKGLLAVCRDGEAGYRLAAERKAHPSLTALLNGYSAQRAEFAQELAEWIERLDGSADTRGTASGALHRGWFRLKSAVGADEGAVISECERGEDVAVRAYKKALSAELPPILRDAVQRQYEQIREAHDRMRTLEIQNRHLKEAPGVATEGAPD